MWYIRTVPMKGKAPKMRLRVLYLPVACTTHPANTDPTDIDILFGIICIPVQRINDSRGGVLMGLPAIEALVIATVWNHIGKKYMIEKLQMATRKLEIPTKTGILRRKRKGANIGSGATKISTKMNAIENITAIITVIITAGLDHCRKNEIGKQSSFICKVRTGWLALYRTLRNTSVEPT
jgi:hypothetical protein